MTFKNTEESAFWQRVIVAQFEFRGYAICETADQTIEALRNRLPASSESLAAADVTLEARLASQNWLVVDVSSETFERAHELFRRVGEGRRISPITFPPDGRREFLVDDLVIVRELLKT